MTMKLTQLIQELSKLGVTFISHEANHDIYERTERKSPFHAMQKSMKCWQGQF